MDLESGETLWRPTKEDSCSRSKHIVLYEGPAKILSTKGPDGNIIQTYIAETGQKLFALRATTPYEACAFKVLKTEHPKLVIVPSQSGTFYFKRGTVPPAALDMLTYINSKFVFLDRTIGKRLEDLHYFLSHQRCMTERKTLTTLLELAGVSPSEFAYAYTEEPGYTANVVGEVIHLVQCHPVEVTIRRTGRCYSELPVTWNNKSVFMAPKTRLIQSHGIEITCSAIVKPMYRLHDNWYALTPDIVRAPAPHQLTPVIPKNYKYESPVSLATGGIYDEQEVEKMWEQVMFPNERQAITNVMVRGVSGQQPDLQGLSIGNMLDQDAVEAIQKGLLSRIWGGFTIFGTMISGVLGLIIAVKVALWLLSTSLNVKVLFDLYGKSKALIWAFSDAATNYLTHKKTQGAMSQWDHKIKLGGQDVCPQVLISAPPKEDEASDSWAPQRKDEGGSKEEKNVYPEIITVRPVLDRAGPDEQAPLWTGESDQNHSQENAVRYALPLNLRRLIP